MDEAKLLEEYKPPLEFEQVVKGPLIDFNLTDSTELWLVQWPVDLDPNFNGKQISLKLNSDGKLGTFEGSPGKSYELFSFKSQDTDATVFLPTASKSKIVGKISRVVSLVHYSDLNESKKDDKLNAKRMAERAAANSLSNSASRGTKSSRSLRGVSGYTTSSMHTSRDKSTILSGERSSKNSSKRKRGDDNDPTRSLGQSLLPDSGRGSGGGVITGSSADSLKTKSKKSKKRVD